MGFRVSISFLEVMKNKENENDIEILVESKLYELIILILMSAYLHRLDKLLKLTYSYYALFLFLHP